MNIIVRVARDQRDHTIEDKLRGDSAFAWWRLSKKPRNAAPGDRVLFQCGNALIGEAEIVFVGDGDGLAQLAPEDAGELCDIGALIAWRPGDGKVYEQPRRVAPARGRWSWRYER